MAIKAKSVGLALAILLFGLALGTILMIPMLYLLGEVVRIPGLHQLLDSVLAANSDGPLMWGLLVLSWLLGIAITYAIVMGVSKSRAVEHGVDR
jgi:hypothetical protein